VVHYPILVTAELLASAGASRDQVRRVLADLVADGLVVRQLVRVESWSPAFLNAPARPDARLLHELLVWLTSSGDPLTPRPTLTYRTATRRLIVRQMVGQVSLEAAGNTLCLPSDLVDRQTFQTRNDRVLTQGSVPTTASAVLLGVTRASLAAVALQETTPTLTGAAVSGTVDRLCGLNETVWRGRATATRTGYVAVPDEPAGGTITTACSSCASAA
jgi:hypothetical protein